MAKRKIKFLVSRFTGYKLIIKNPVLAEITITSQFDQIAAEDLDIKDELFDKHGATAKDVHGWSLGLEYHGATLRVLPRQSTTDGKVTIDGDGIALASLHAHSFSVKKPQDEGGPALRISFKATMLDENGEAHKLVHGLKRDEFDLVLELPTIQVAKKAKETLELFGKSTKDEEEAEDGAEEE